MIRQKIIRVLRKWWWWLEPGWLIEREKVDAFRLLSCSAWGHTDDLNWLGLDRNQEWILDFYLEQLSSFSALSWWEMPKEKQFFWVERKTSVFCFVLSWLGYILDLYKWRHQGCSWMLKSENVFQNWIKRFECMWHVDNFKACSWIISTRELQTLQR